MLKDKAEIVVDGYGTSEVDFLTRLIRDDGRRFDCCRAFRPGRHTRFISPGLFGPRVYSKPPEGRQCASGHRYLARRPTRSTASRPRQLALLFVFVRFAGAAVLINNQLNLTEEQRKENRRLQIRLVTFQP
jgi:hypothetical protein